MEAFVYCWTNKTNNKKYIGYHKGNPDDGYICSSRSNEFWEDWNKHEWSRSIIAYGSCAECVSLEKSILTSIDLNNGEYYNNGVGGIIFTDEVRKKMRREFPEEHKKKLSDAKKGKKISKEHAKKLHDGRRNSNYDHSVSMKKVHEERKGNWLSENGKENIRQWNKSRPKEMVSRVASIAGKASVEAYKNSPERQKAKSERMKQWWAERKMKGST